MGELGIGDIHETITSEIKDKKQFPGYIQTTTELEFKELGFYDHNIDSRLNILGISTTNTPENKQPPKNRSTSEDVLIYSLDYAKKKHDCNTVLVKLRELEIAPCEGFYSADKTSCQWPCFITERDQDKDKMDVIYYGIVKWADIVLVSTPIRFGNASATYYKMAERLNSVHNQMTISKQHVDLIKDKVAGFIITGGQDGVQAVAGQLMTFWSEMGFIFPRYSYVGWNRGWYAENTKWNYPLLMKSQEFKADLENVIDSAVDLKKRLNSTSYSDEEYHRKFTKDKQVPEQYDPASEIMMNRT